MADDGDPVFDTDGIQKLFAKAKSSGETYSFAFGLASKPKECGFAVHLRKPGAVLKKELKSSSKAIRKACFGTFTLDGALVKLSSEKPLKGIVKQLKVRFREEGLLKFKPILVGPDGAEIDEETLPDDTGDDEDDDALDQAEAVEAEASPDTDTLKARLVAVRARIEALDKDRAAPLVAAFAKAVGQVRDGDTGAAAQTLDLIARALDRLAPPAAAPAAAPAGGDAAAKMTQALTTLVPRIRALAAGPAQQALAASAREAQALIAGGDAPAAVAALKALAAEIAAAERDSTAPATVEIWTTAKEQVDTGIAKLQSALRGAGHPDTDRIAEFGLAGLSGGGVQTAMMAALMDYDRAAPADRAKAAGKLRKAIGDYRSFLSGNRLVELCEGNPFGVAVDIRGPFTAALGQIEDRLPA
ncbi:hypothetical protein [Defluviimonas sp. WL0075]|uniref:Uncharacterized protein n=1 Tax=Albidovulum sediminicola TaxID=2984331 RepID=A0ABT2YXE5_9RHOB|nr:hypothetical protein [Defluviimonas sp. WL0075]MCV2863543.1 hypothetical protein [Defluviimonas sp. WL0075]